MYKIGSQVIRHTTILVMVLSIVIDANRFQILG